VYHASPGRQAKQLPEVSERQLGPAGVAARRERSLRHPPLGVLHCDDALLHCLALRVVVLDDQLHQRKRVLGDRLHTKNGARPSSSGLAGLPENAHDVCHRIQAGKNRARSSSDPNDCRSQFWNPRSYSENQIHPYFQDATGERHSKLKTLVLKTFGRF
jgi:hypothetical protein